MTDVLRTKKIDFSPSGKGIADPVKTACRCWVGMLCIYVVVSVYFCKFKNKTNGKCEKGAKNHEIY